MYNGVAKLFNSNKSYLNNINKTKIKNKNFNSIM